MKIKFIESNDNLDNLCIVAFVFNVGQKHDIIPGMSHLAEHMSCRGSSNKSSFDIMSQVQNAYTTPERTCFIFRPVQPEDVTETVKFAIQNMFTNNTLDSFDKEKNIIRCELNAYIDGFFKGNNATNNCLNDAVFSSWNNTNKSLDIKEHKKALNSILKDELYIYKQFAYSPQKCTLYIVGQTNEYIENSIQDVLDEWYLNHTKTLNNLKKRNKHINHYLKQPKDELKYSSKVHFKYLPTENVYIDFILNATPNGTLKELMISNIIRNLTNTYPYSPLCEQIRIKDGLSYYDSSSILNMLVNCNALTFSSFTTKDSFKPFLKSSLTALKSIKNLITSENVDNIKSCLYDDMAMKNNDSYSMLQKHIFLDQHNVNMDDMLNIINSITYNDVKLHYDKMINTGISYSICGNISNDEYQQLPRELNSLYHDILLCN